MRITKEYIHQLCYLNSREFAEAVFQNSIYIEYPTMHQTGDALERALERHKEYTNIEKQGEDNGKKK